jgi:ubiquinone/menaquinone biosynthesis C-methylase UbiE
MNIRIGFALFFVRLGRFIQTLALSVMRPDDLVQFSQEHYSSLSSVEGWTADALVDTWLTSDEKILLKKIPIDKGHLLLLGMGGGREAVPLAQEGFEVTGVDFVSDMVEKAKESAAKQGLVIKGLVQDISRLDVPQQTYELVWFSGSLYSCIPTRKRRIAMLKKIHTALKSGGYCLCQCHLSRSGKKYPLPDVFRKIFAWMTLGHIRYEPGDVLWGNSEFLHEFSSLDELRSEFSQAGFSFIDSHIYEGGVRVGAILKKIESTSILD